MPEPPLIAAPLRHPHTYVRRQTDTDVGDTCARRRQGEGTYEATAIKAWAKTKTKAARNAGATFNGGDALFDRLVVGAT